MGTLCVSGTLLAQGVSVDVLVSVLLSRFVLSRYLIASMLFMNFLLLAKVIALYRGVLNDSHWTI
jgi:hypothetical protein